MWSCLLDSRRDAELNKIPKWKKYWKLLQKKDTKEAPEALEKLQFERSFLSSMIKKFLSVLYTVQEKEAPQDVVDFCERFLILMIDLEALLDKLEDDEDVQDDPAYMEPSGIIMGETKSVLGWCVSWRRSTPEVPDRPRIEKRLRWKAEKFAECLAVLPRAGRHRTWSYSQQAKELKQARGRIEAAAMRAQRAG